MKASCLLHPTLVSNGNEQAAYVSSPHSIKH